MLGAIICLARIWSHFELTGHGYNRSADPKSLILINAAASYLSDPLIYLTLVAFCLASSYPILQNRSKLE